MSCDERLSRIEARIPGTSKDLEGALLLEPETLDAAIVGVIGGRAVYDREQLIQAFVQDSGSDMATAEEHVAYNVERSLPYYEHARGPILVDPWDEDMIDIIGEDLGLWAIELGGRRWIATEREVVDLASHPAP